MTSPSHLAMTEFPSGASKDGRGYDVVFLHGFMGQSHDFAAVASRLCECPLIARMIALDLPGHGRSVDQSMLQFSDTRTFLAIITATIRHCHLRRTLLVGYSMGGRLALQLVQASPDLFAALVLESSSPGISDSAARESRYRDDLALFNAVESGQESFAQFLAHFYRKPVFGSLVHHPQFDALLADKLCNNPILLQKVLNVTSPGACEPLWSELCNMTIPILCLSGAEDQKYTEIGAQMAAAAPTIRHQVIECCAHNIHFAAPTAFCAAIMSFLKLIRAEVP